MMIVLIGLVPIFFLSKTIRYSRPGAKWKKKYYLSNHYLLNTKKM
jgi:hypothetical protein